jgi:hypothetical protein
MWAALRRRQAAAAHGSVKRRIAVEPVGSQVRQQSHLNT